MYLRLGHPPQDARQVHAGHLLACQPCEKLKGIPPKLPESRGIVQDTRSLEKLKEPPLDQSHHPQNHPGTEERLLENRRVLKATGISRSGQIDKYKSFLDDTLAIQARWGQDASINKSHGR